jgi:hypothetical protein
VRIKFERWKKFRGIKLKKVYQFYNLFKIKNYNKRTEPKYEELTN